MEAAAERGIPVRGELSLFATALVDLKADLRYAPKVLAITGTNGKTTTTSLTAQLVELRQACRLGWQHWAYFARHLRIALEQERSPSSAMSRVSPSNCLCRTWMLRPTWQESQSLEASDEVVAGEVEASVEQATEQSVEAEAGAAEPALTEDADAPLVVLAPRLPKSRCLKCCPRCGCWSCLASNWMA